MTDECIYIAPIPEDARPVYNLIRGLIKRGETLSHFQAAMTRIEAEATAKAVETRVAKLLKDSK